MIARFVGAAVVGAAVVIAPAPAASAEPCPDVDVVFARGTNEAPGLGGIGQGFVDAFRSRADGQSVNAYAVDYPASIDFPTATQGIDDASRHIQAVAASCPDTRIVLGGFSQGAAVAGFVTAHVVPDDLPKSFDVPDSFDTEPLPPAVADHVAAVVLFGKPSPRFLSAIDAPNIVVGPLYADKVIDLCATGDPVCSDGRDGRAHSSYVRNGMADQAAAFAVSRL